MRAYRLIYRWFCRHDWEVATREPPASFLYLRCSSCGKSRNKHTYDGRMNVPPATRRDHNVSA
jgi:hypothetical protein